MKDQKPDDIYASPLEKVSEFTFDEAVARVFPDMIRRSVPGYTTIIPMIGLITEQYAQDGSACYDLGCSLGASTLAMRHGLKDKTCQLLAIDNSLSMIERCNHYIELDNEQTPVELLCADITKIDLAPCSVVTLNFTLQFIATHDRLALLKKIYEALKPGGVLILSEKICFDKPHEQSTLEELHWSFKKANGYSELEVSQKRSALEQVLLPDTLQAHQLRLKTAGFEHQHLWYQCFNFISLVAIKSA
jgi:tRNA (cmo5U34)-methyltransferase